MRWKFISGYEIGLIIEKKRIGEKKWKENRKALSRFPAENAVLNIRVTLQFAKVIKYLINLF
jgi:hypothetical protein